MGRPNWESTQPTLTGKWPLNGPYKVWLMPWVSSTLGVLSACSLTSSYEFLEHYFLHEKTQFLGYYETVHNITCKEKYLFIMNYLQMLILQRLGF